MPERLGCLSSLFGFLIKLAWRPVPDISRQESTHPDSLKFAERDAYLALCQQAIDARLKYLTTSPTLHIGLNQQAVGQNPEQAASALEASSARMADTIRKGLLEQRSALVKEQGPIIYAPAPKS